MFDAMVNRLVLDGPQAALSRLRIMMLRAAGAKIGPHCWTRNISVPRNPWDVQLEQNVALDSGVVLLTSGDRRPGRPRILIKRAVYVNRFTMLDASELITIGPDTMIGPFCYITDHDHGTSRESLVKKQPLESEPTQIGSNVWLGAGVCILKGVTIGDNAVVGAGAVVSRSVERGARVAGVPARQIGLPGTLPLLQKTGHI